ncbi:MAG: 3-dehydroquinate synthase, partial [Pseudomonadota bacterium]
TFGHAIEAGTGYGSWLHGEAVAAGMRVAAELSARKGWIDPADVERITRLLLHARLPVNVPAAMSTANFMDLMAVDKKVRDGKLRLVLLERMNHAVLVDNVETALLHETIEACREATPDTGSAS